MRLDAQDIRRQAFGRWPDILAALGIPAEVLSKRRNQPCPCCGGTDRFEFIDKGTGRFVCRVGVERQGGDGIALVRHWLGCDFPTALRAVAGALGLGDGVEAARTPAAPAARPAPARHDNSATIARLWSEALPIRAGDPVACYLANRGLDLAAYPATLRHHPALPYWIELDGKSTKFVLLPALLALVTGPDGKPAALHRIYLDASGRKSALAHPTTGEPLDAKKLLTATEGAMRGAAVRLYEPVYGLSALFEQHGPDTHTLALAEGIETALAVRLGSGLPCWACVSAWGLENIVLPATVTDVYVMGDHDVSGIGQRAAERLAKRLLGEGRRVRVVIPERAGTDWLDVFNQQRQQEAAA